MKTTFTPGPSVSQMFALITYANGHGRTWKQQLLDDWMNGKTDSELQQVRNQFGPSWLARFKLPKVEIVATGKKDHPLRAIIIDEAQRWKHYPRRASRKLYGDAS